MAQIFLGIALLALFLYAARWFANANPGTLARGVKWGVGTLLVLLALFLLVTGRLAWAFAALAAAIPWIMRLLHFHALWRSMQGAWSRFGQQGQPRQGQTSRVDSRFLRMELDHDTGSMDGEVLEGAFQGRLLSSLSLREAAALWRECSGDDQSRQLFEAWLDRERPEWLEELAAGGARQRERSGGGGDGTGATTRAEALEVLGLDEGARPEEIHAAYRRLMAKLHPDRGGSNWLAARINQARDLLLSEVET